MFLSRLINICKISLNAFVLQFLIIQNRSPLTMYYFVSATYDTSNRHKLCHVVLCRNYCFCFKKVALYLKMLIVNLKSSLPNVLGLDEIIAVHFDQCYVSPSFLQVHHVLFSSSVKIRWKCVFLSETNATLLPRVKAMFVNVNTAPCLTVTSDQTQARLF